MLLILSKGFAIQIVSVLVVGLFGRSGYTTALTSLSGKKKVFVATKCLLISKKRKKKGILSPQRVSLNCQTLALLTKLD